MMGVILKKDTDRHRQIEIWYTTGEMDSIMGEYKRVYDNPDVTLDVPEQ